MKTIKDLSEQLNAEIIAFIENNPIKHYWDYNDKLSKYHILSLLKHPEDGLWMLEDEILMNNMDYEWENKKEFVKDTLISEFRDQLISEGITEDELLEFCMDSYSDIIYTDYNVNELIKKSDDLLCVIPVYSNYDCTNSFDTMDNCDYLPQVFKRVKEGVRKSDFIYEHQNGAYGGSLFCFIFKTDILNLIELKQKMKTGQSILIPKGTQFGFFSSFQGAGSVFEKTTYRNFKLNIKETKPEYCEYDHVDLIADIEQSYSFKDVYGCSSDFANEQTIFIK